MKDSQIVILLMLTLGISAIMSGMHIVTFINREPIKASPVSSSSIRIEHTTMDKLPKLKGCDIMSLRLTDLETELLIVCNPLKSIIQQQGKTNDTKRITEGL